MRRLERRVSDVSVQPENYKFSEDEQQEAHSDCSLSPCVVTGRAMAGVPVGARGRGTSAALATHGLCVQVHAVKKRPSGLR